MNFFRVQDSDVCIFGEIGLFADFNDFRNAVGDRSDLNLWIDSIGGNSVWALQAFNLLRGRVREASICKAYSASVILAMAAPIIRIESGARMMIHGLRQTCYCDRLGLLAEAENLKAITEKIERIICERTGLKSKIVRRWLGDGQDHFFTAEQCVAIGLADEVVNTPKLPALAQVYQMEAMPNDDGKAGLLMELLQGFGTIRTDRAKLMRDLHAWAFHNIQEAK